MMEPVPMLPILWHKRIPTLWLSRFGGLLALLKQHARQQVLGKLKTQVTKP